jgi:hypothetical protein
MEVLLELHRIVEMRGGAVYRTEFVRRDWFPVNEEAPEGYLLVSLSTRWLAENPDADTMRIRR